jgi:hypothetical protein
MKSIFLIFIITISFNSLILTSGPNPSAIARIAAALEAAVAERDAQRSTKARQVAQAAGAAAAVAIATTEKHIPEVLFCPKCLRTSGALRVYKERTAFAHGDILKYCIWCLDELVADKTIAEKILEEKAEAAASAVEKRADQRMFCPNCFRKGGLHQDCIMCAQELVPKRVALEKISKGPEISIIQDRIAKEAAEVRTALEKIAIEKRIALEKIAVEFPADKAVARRARTVHFLE